MYLASMVTIATVQINENFNSPIEEKKRGPDLQLWCSDLKFGM